MSHSLKGQIEALLFLTGRPLTVKDLAEKLTRTPEEVEEALLDLINDYGFRDDSALEIEDSDGYILQVKEDYSVVVNRMVPVDLSTALLRTLSVVAVHSPLKQSDLIELRGASAYDHVKALLQHKLIQRKRNKRGFTLSVTPVFHEYFKLTGDKQELQRMVTELKESTDSMPLLADDDDDPYIDPALVPDEADLSDLVIEDDPVALEVESTTA